MKIESSFNGVLVPVEMVSMGTVFEVEGVVYLIPFKGDVNVGIDNGVLCVNLNEDKIEFLKPGTLGLIVDAKVVITGKED